MFDFAITLLAGILALTGVGAIVRAALARSGCSNHRALRLAQITLTLSGLVLFVSALAGGEMMNLFGGLMLVIFGTGVTAIRRRSDQPA